MPFCCRSLWKILSIAVGSLPCKWRKTTTMRFYGPRKEWSGRTAVAALIGPTSLKVGLLPFTFFMCWNGLISRSMTLMRTFALLIISNHLPGFTGIYGLTMETTCQSSTLALNPRNLSLWGRGNFPTWHLLTMAWRACRGLSETSDKKTRKRAKQSNS